MQNGDVDSGSVSIKFDLLIIATRGLKFGSFDDDTLLIEPPSVAKDRKFSADQKLSAIIAKLTHKISQLIKKPKYVNC